MPAQEKTQEHDFNLSCTYVGAQQDQLYINPLSSSSAHLKKFHFVGLFMAKAILESAARGRYVCVPVPLHACVSVCAYLFVHARV